MSTPEFKLFWRRRHGGDDNGGGDDDGNDTDNPGNNGGGEEEPNDPDHRGRSTTVNNIGTPTARPAPSPTSTFGTRSSASPERSNEPERSASPERSSAGNPAATATASLTATVRGTGAAVSTSLGPVRTSSSSPERSASPERSSFNGASSGLPATATNTFGAIRSAEPLNLSSSQNKMSGGSIAGIIIGALGALGLALGALLFLRRRNRAKNRRALQASLAFRELGEKIPVSGQRNNYTQGTGRGEFDNNPETMGAGNPSQSRTRSLASVGHIGGVNRSTQAAESPFRD